MSTLAICGGTVIDALGSRVADVCIGDDGTIIAVEQGIDADRVLDASGCVVCPSFVDLHVHLREPGDENAETIATGARAAALGGYGLMVAMPNTNPVADNVALIEQVRALAKEAICRVMPSAAISIGRRGKELSPMAELVRAGVRMFTDDGDGLQDEKLMRTALEYVGSLAHLCEGENLVVAQHCEVSSLSEGGYMNEGKWSSWLGIPGQPAEAEELMVMRDIALCRLTGAKVHFQHMSTAGSVSMIRAAKAAGLPITAEATTHHFSLTEASCATYDPRFKVHPPLRTDEDVQAVKDGLKDGTIDAIATDHAPHTDESKDRTFAEAPPGMLGLETAFAVANTNLEMPLEAILATMSWQPAKIAGVHRNYGGPIARGKAANLTVIDPNMVWEVVGSQLASISSNTPYENMSVKGKVRHTIYNGEAVVVDGEVIR